MKEKTEKIYKVGILKDELFKEEEMKNARGSGGFVHWIHYRTGFIQSVEAQSTFGAR